MGRTHGFRKYSRNFNKKSRKRSTKHKKNKRTVKRRQGVKNRRTRRIMRGGRLKKQHTLKNNPIRGKLEKTRYQLSNFLSKGKTILNPLRRNDIKQEEWHIMPGATKTRYYIINVDTNNYPQLTYFAEDNERKPKGVIPLHNATIDYNKETPDDKTVYLEYNVFQKSIFGYSTPTSQRVKLKFETGEGFNWLKEYIPTKKESKIINLNIQIARILKNINELITQLKNRDVTSYEYFYEFEHLKRLKDSLERTTIDLLATLKERYSIDSIDSIDIQQNLQDIQQNLQNDEELNKIEIEDIETIEGNLTNALEKIYYLTVNIPKLTPVETSTPSRN